MTNDLVSTQIEILLNLSVLMRIFILKIYNAFINFPPKASKFPPLSLSLSLSRSVSVLAVLLYNCNHRVAKTYYVLL